MSFEDYVSNLPKTGISVSFGEYELEEILSGFRTASVSGREQIEYDINENEIPRRAGSIYEYKKQQPRTIEITFNLTVTSRDDYQDQIDKIKLYTTEENVELSFADQPNTCYIGNIESIDTDPPTYMSGSDCYYGTGIIMFRCSDPYLYAKQEKTATNNIKADEITLLNEGTADVPIDVEVVMNSDNGYIGLTLADRFYQVGNPEEVDKEEYEGSVTVFSDSSSTIYSSWSLNDGVLPPPKNNMNLREGGTVTISGDTVLANEYGSASQSGNVYWHGPSLTKAVPSYGGSQYPLNWTCVAELDFHPDENSVANDAACLGMNALTFSDQNGDIILSLTIEDAERTMYYVTVSVASGDDIIMQKWGILGPRNNFQPAYVSSVTIEKMGSTATVSFLLNDERTVTSKFTIQNSSSALRKITWFGAQYVNQRVMTVNGIKSVSLKRHNVDMVEDIPNYFSDGDVVRLDGKKNQLYINDYLNWDMVDIGSQPLLLPPGQHTLGIIASSFATSPSVTVKYKERWK